MNGDSRREMALFTEAVQLPAEERKLFLERACAGDETLRRKVEALLKANDRAGNFLENSGTRPPIEARPEAPIGEKPGDRIGRYKLLQQIGEGGWGIVFMAEQEEPVRRKVALKIVKPGMDTRNVVARFEAERQALALMGHPNIAHVFDAGATDSGRPYFVMELVRGVKITDYCDQHSLTTSARLDLFIQVCDAVQHAHQKGIIHRDIKPSNILVATLGDGRALPKVIDFGIAKATTGERLTDKTVFTAFEMLIGTPSYMSPEQAALTNVEVDTRTDIYSLGVLLYELLTGTTPFDTRELLKAGLDEVRRVIRTEEPLRPSTRLVKMVPTELTALSQRRRAGPSILIRELRGDLDCIVMKALEKDPCLRYATANGLALDVRRFLAGEPIIARRPSTLYRLQKTYHRNKFLFAGIGAIALLLIAGLIFVSVSFTRERQARRESDNEKLKARVEIKFLAKSLYLVGDRMRQRGNLQDASSVLESALSIQRKVLGEDNPETLDTLRSLGMTLEDEGKLTESVQVHREALAGWDGLGEDETPQALWERKCLLHVLVAQKNPAHTEQVLDETLNLPFVTNSASEEYLDLAVNLEGRLGKWDKAAAHATLALSNEPMDVSRYCPLAALLVKSHNLTAYEQLRRHFFSTFGSTTNVYLADSVAKTCLFLPPSKEDLPVISRLTDMTVTLGKKDAGALPFYQYCKALSEYRQANFAEAAEWAQKSINGPRIDARGPAYAVLAMACWQLGEKDEAREMLARGNALTPKMADLGEDWLKWLYARIFLDEATALIQP